MPETVSHSDSLLSAQYRDDWATGLREHEAIDWGKMSGSEEEIRERKIASEKQTARLGAKAWIAFEFERALSLLHGVSPLELSDSTPMVALFPLKGRKEAWTRLGEAMDLKLPKPGTPPLLQHLLGFMLLAGMVLPFWSLWWGLGLFWGTVILLFLLEKWLQTFTIARLGDTILRTVELNPMLEESFYANPGAAATAMAEIKKTHAAAGQNDHRQIS